MAAEAAIVYLTRDRWGALSNMASGFPVKIGEVDLGSTEALYQALKFPHSEDVQRQIIRSRTPKDAKRVSRRNTGGVRPDWNQVRVRVMRWCLRIKLLQHPGTFGQVLMSTGSLPIVERSRRDSFWGAEPRGDVLTGCNVLGRLLMELRKEVLDGSWGADPEVPGPKIPRSVLLGRETRAQHSTQPWLPDLLLSWAQSHPGEGPG